VALVTATPQLASQHAFRTRCDVRGACWCGCVSTATPAQKLIVVLCVGDKGACWADGVFLGFGGVGQQLWDRVVVGSAGGTWVGGGGGVGRERRVWEERGRKKG